MNNFFFGLLLTTLAFTTDAMPTGKRPCIFVYRPIKNGVAFEKIIFTDDRDNEGKTPLHHAAISGNVKFAKKLLEINADVESTDNSGKTPLYYAALHGKETGNNQCADFLIIQSRADISALQEETELQNWVAATIQRLGLSENYLENDQQESNQNSGGDFGLGVPIFGHCLGLCLFS